MNMRHQPIPGHLRVKAIALAIVMALEICMPSLGYALTSGPTQPEFTSFEPAVTTTMVNEFTGDLTYNLPILEIPGPDGSSYPLSLSYHSGAQPEQEASWVGYGWTLNPGAINRQKNGIPDDWNGKVVTHHNRTVPVRTISATGSANGEAFSFDLPVGASATVRYNNYNGMAQLGGIGIRPFKGFVSIGINVSNSGMTFDMTINPANLLNYRKVEKTKETYDLCTKDGSDLDDALSMASETGNFKNIDLRKTTVSQPAYVDPRSSSLGSYSISTLSPSTYTLEMQPGTGSNDSYNFMFNLTTPALEVGVQGNATIAFSTQRTEPERDLRNFGYLYSSSAGIADAMDYHAENPTTFNKRDKFIPPALNDHDLFLATGEGILGSMRLHTRMPGRYRPPALESHTELSQLGVQIQAGGTLGGGMYTSVSGDHSLSIGEAVAPEHEPPLDENYFFRMNNDKGGYVTHTSVQPERVSVGLEGVIGYMDPTYTSDPIVENMMNSGDRSARSAYIGFTTGNDELTSRYELSPLSNYVVDPCTDPADSDLDLIQELSVVNTSGSRYNYGLPVYALSEKSISYHYGAPLEIHSNKYIANIDDDLDDLDDDDIEEDIAEEDEEK